MGKLVLVGTPIGNLADISPRTRDSLAAADVVAAEDTRHSGLLLQHLGLKKPLISYYQHNRKEREELLLHHLSKGETVALVTDAGMPAISDPGWEIVAAAAAAGHEVDGIPGPCALILALVLSGLPTQRFAFEGFLPRGKEARAALTVLAKEERTLIFYEAPHRLIDTLTVMASCFGSMRPSACCRELTKKFQEVHRAPLGEQVAYFQANPPRGEFTIVVGPALKQEVERPTQATLLVEAKRLLSGGMKHKAAAKEVAGRYGISVKEVYQLILEENAEK